MRQQGRHRLRKPVALILLAAAAGLSACESEKTQRDDVRVDKDRVDEVRVDKPVDKPKSSSWFGD